METEKKQIYEIEDVILWIEQESSIHIKAITKFGDPVELSSTEALELGKLLITLAKQLN